MSSLLCHFLRTSRVGFEIIAVAAAFAVPALSQSSSFRFASLFTDNVVLQQRSTVPVWGTGIAGTPLLLRASWGKELRGQVGSDGNWMMKLPTPKAGGPFQMTMQYGDTIFVLRNVLIGEVWLCSGQSNMEMPVGGWPPSDTVANAQSEIDRALFPTIRLFTVKHAYEAVPKDFCVGNWVECSPVDIRTFSATAYFFGRMLSTTLNVPIGLINSSYGGTPIEAWTSAKGLAQFSEFAESLNKLERSKDSIIVLDRWVTQHPAITINERDPFHRWEGLKFQDDDCSQRNFNDSTWPEMKLPTLWEQTSMGDFDGAVWFRKLVSIPSAWKGRDLVLQLGPIDDMDETYVNGELVGSHLKEGFWSVDRVYKIPGSIVKDSLLLIAVRVLDQQGGGGIWQSRKMKMMVLKEGDSTGVSLEGNWKYMPVAEFRSNVFYVYGAKGNEFDKRPKIPIGFGSGTPTALYNGMINPLVPFTIKGVIWYQGENNVYEPELYKRLFPAMISDWRATFLSGNFPFYFVQLAPYSYGNMEQSQYLREAQMQTLSVENTGMAVTMDIGSAKTIHPADKQDVGKRLALWALAKTYGKKIPFSGPLYKSMKVARGKIILSFDYAGRGLLLKDQNGENDFTIAGEDHVFKKAVVQIQGKTLVVSSPEVPKPVAVRYAWDNTEAGTLFNKEGLPASSFRTDDWPRQ
jgi:sialate O-acetylesterase